MTPIRSNSVLPAERVPITIPTADGLTLVGELALPVAAEPVATLICVHPLPTHGGMMDSHILRKAAWRLPALAGIAVLRFNTRGTTSAAGTSQGAFDDGVGEGFDLTAAIAFAGGRDLPDPWLLGWSFGTDVVLRHGNVDPVRGAILLSPPLRYSTDADLVKWAASRRPLVALIPELDDYLRPTEARQRFSMVAQCEIDVVEGARHLWVGESYVRIVLDEVVRRVHPESFPLPTNWSGPMTHWNDLA